jgi:outer membrane lipoprotein-sorting protein
VDGREAASYAVRSIRFDERIPVEAFTFVPPAGTTVVRAGGADGSSRASMRRWWRR